MTGFAKSERLLAVRLPHYGAHLQKEATHMQQEPNLEDIVERLELLSGW